MKKGLLFRLMCLTLAVVTVFSSAGCSFTSKDEQLISVPISVISSIGASEAKGNIIPVDSDFNIITNESVSEKALKEMLELEPETEFTIKKVSDKNYKLIPDEPFEDSSLVRIKAMAGKKTAYEWAFETDGSLHVVKSYPCGTARPDSGIEVKLSYMDVENFEKCFSITPEVKGSVTCNGKSRIFVPDEDLPEGKYTVTVSGDLKTSAGKTLGEDYVFSFRIKENGVGFAVRQCRYSSNDTFRKDENPKAMLSGFSDGIIKADVRAVDDSLFSEIIKKYFNSYYYYYDGEEPPVDFSVFNKLPEFRSFSFESNELSQSGEDGYYNESILTYPSTYPAGKYITRFIDADGEETYHIFQVSSIAVYALSITGSITVWVNSCVTDKPVKGCEVILDGIKGKTGENGTASFPAEDTESGMLEVNAGEERFMTCLRDVYESGMSDYYTDLYLESNLYAPGDTVKVWGCVVPRYGKKMPDKVMINYEGDEFEQVKPDKNGCFKFTFVTSSPADSWDSVELLIENGHTQSFCQERYFCVCDYELPSSSIIIETDKKAYFAGESADISVTATAFDGTPQKYTGIVLDVMGEDYHLTTDAKGKASIRIDELGNAEKEIRYFIEYGYISARLESEEESYSNEAEERIVIAWADYCAELETDNENVLNVSAYEIKLDKINKMTDSEHFWLYDEDSDIYKGKSVDVGFYLEAIERYTQKSEISTTYDFINNERQPVYDEEEMEEVVYSGNQVTRNGSLTLPLDSYRKNDGSLTVETEFICEGRVITPYCNNRYSDYYRPENKYYVETGKNSYSLGDTVKAKIKSSDGQKPSVETALFIIAAPDKRETLTAVTSEISFEFDKNYKDGASVYAAFFDGKKIHYTNPEFLTSDYNFRLDITVKPDKEIYRPGDKVNLDISVKDADGNPVSCGGVTNVIDEALYSVLHSDPEMFYERYEFYGYTVYSSTWDSDRPYYDDGGGGGDGPLRADFEDMPYFDILSTGGDGNAEVSFKLPDSVTSWHITVKAIDKEGRSGYKDIEIPATLEYFLYTTGIDRFCVKDDICFGAKIMGLSEDTEDESTVTAMILDEKGREKCSAQTAEIKAGEYADFNFGKLPVGTYKMRISSECGKYTDSIEKEINVVESKLSTAVFSERSLTDSSGLSLDTASRAQICLVDEMYSEYAGIIDKLYSYSGQRFDMKLARDFAQEWSSGGFDCRDYRYRDFSGYWYEDDEEYDSDSESTPFKDVELVALYNITFSERFSGDYYADYYDGFSNDQINGFTNTERIMYYTILATYGEPVITALDEISKKSDSLSVAEKAWLGIAYSAAGQYDKAKAVQQYLVGLMKENKSGLYYKDKDEYASEYLTSLIALLSFRINATESKKLIDTLLNTKFKRHLPVFELINYILCYAGNTVKKDTVEINTGNKTVKAEFLSTDYYCLILSPDEIKNATFRCIDCNAVAICRYYSSVSTAVTEGKTDSPVRVSIPDNLSKGDMFNLEITVSTNDRNNYAGLDFVLPAGVSSSGQYSVECDGEERSYYCSSGGMDADYRSFHIGLFGETEYKITVPCFASFAGDFVLEKFVATEENSIIHTAEDTSIKIA